LWSLAVSNWMYQTDLIPASAWAQYPLVILFGIASLVAFRAHLQEQDKWRTAQKELLEILREERRANEQSLLAALKDQRDAQVEMLKMMQQAARENFEAIMRVQGETFEEAIDKIAGQYYRLNREYEEGKKS
jgi:biopolymer transport protein ExbB/TolQ